MGLGLVFFEMWILLSLDVCACMMVQGLWPKVVTAAMQVSRSAFSTVRRGCKVVTPRGLQRRHKCRQCCGC